METWDYWPIIDTSVKVAMGALIAGLAFWLSSRGGHWFSQARTPINRRLTLLEEISAAVGDVNHVFSKYSALVIESTRFGSRWPEARKEELEHTNRELVKEFRKLADAEAKLLMLGEKVMEKTLRLYGARIAYFRKQVYVGRQDISEKEIALIKRDIVTLREQFYDLLSKRYDRLLAI
ncbi:energy transducer TonB [Exilibacterium tricleocarpae]|uniref:Energy transducer TonB n=1 Tax=Exilibacterium tricleocarpae TaxID=2591008 RepID=A0A545UA00_9GAMM|nr:energy transducer TonB [Exilibacterium tricleocarpae]TQV86291.1 energy transducer TonB [Exilibacterium tricleocarpae]